MLVYLEFALGLHQLQLGLGQLQLHLSQLDLQTLLLLILLPGPPDRRCVHSPHTAFFVEKTTALLTAFHFELERDTMQRANVRNNKPPPPKKLRGNRTMMER